MNRRVVASLFAALCACSSDPSTGPIDEPFVGELASPIQNVLGRPFGITTSGAGGTQYVYVTSQDLNHVMRIPAAGGSRDSASVGADPGDVVLTANGLTLIISTFIDGDLHFLNANTGAETDFTSIGTNAYRLAVSSNGANVFVTTTGGMLYSVSLTTGNKLDSLQLAGSLQGIARRNDGTIAVASTAGTITLVDPATLDAGTSTAVGASTQEIVFSPDGSHLFVARESGAVHVLNGTTLAAVDTIEFAGANALAPFGMAMSPDGTVLVVTGMDPALGGTGRVALVNVATRAITTMLPVGGTPRRAAFNAAGNRAYVANEAGRIDVIR